MWVIFLRYKSKPIISLLKTVSYNCFRNLYDLVPYSSRHQNINPLFLSITTSPDSLTFLLLEDKVLNHFRAFLQALLSAWNILLSAFHVTSSIFFLNNSLRFNRPIYKVFNLVNLDNQDNKCIHHVQEFLCVLL